MRSSRSAWRSERDRRLRDGRPWYHGIRATRARFFGGLEMTRPAIAALFAAALIEGCAGSHGAQSALAPMQGSQQPLSSSRSTAPRSASCVLKPCIFVANPSPGRRPHARALIYDGEASGNAAPLNNPGKKTGLAHPGAVAVDDDRNIYVINGRAAGPVTVYAAGAGGNVPRSRRLAARIPTSFLRPHRRGRHSQHLYRG